MLGLALFFAPPARADDLRAQQKIRTGILYSFLKYTDWPPREGDGEVRFLNVCLFGGDPFHGALRALEGRPAQQYTIHVSRPRDFGAVGGCDVLFIDDRQSRQLPVILARARDGSIMTMSGIDHFAAGGGMVEFAMRDGKLHLIINNKAAADAGIHIQPRMLDIAEVIAP